MSKGKGGGSQQPSGQTVTTTNQSPWAPQQPYLEEALKQAANLQNGYTPEYFPGSTYAPVPATAYGANNEIYQAAPLANRGANIGYDYSNGLLSGQERNNDLSLGPLFNYALQPNLGQTAPGASTLAQFASGAAADPFLGTLSQSTLAQIVPSIQKQFIEGGGLSSPQAAYATSQGASAALAPILSQAFQQQQGVQLNAAQQSVQNALASQGQAITAATNFGNQWSNDAQKQVQALALLPQTLQAQYTGATGELQAGNQAQTWQQQAINDEIQRWNYAQTLPYQKLNEYIGQVSGNYGGTGQQINPYYTNTGASALGGGIGGALLGSQILGPAGFGLTSSGLGAGIGGGLGILLGI